MSAPARFANASAAGHDGPPLRDLPHTAAFVDAFGERQLVFDPGSGLSLEVLQFRPEFSKLPEFETELRTRVEAVKHVQHPSLATIQSVERSGESLSLVSKYTAGRRVSELLAKAHGPAFALELIRLVTPALAALQRVGDGVAHGTLSAERIVVTRDGRLVVVEHVLGSAINAMRLSRHRLLELGLVVPVAKNDEQISLTPRTDLMQLAFLALALLMGRRLDAADYPEKVPALLDEFALNAGSPMLAAKLRTWLERSMQLSTKAFASARDAHTAFSDLPDDVDVQVATSLVAFPKEAATTPAKTGGPNLHSASLTSLEDFPSEKDSPARPRAAASRGGRRWGVWIGGALAVLAVAEGVALYLQPFSRPAAELIEVRPARPAVEATGAAALPANALAAAALGAAAPVTTAAPAVAPTATGPAAAKPDGQPVAASSAPAVPVANRFGGVTVSSPIDLQVYESGKLLGSTAGPIALNEGPHSVEFVNETLGFRLPQSVNVKGGQMTTVNIAVPKGRISINAVPWAEVDIDGTPAGQTPIANFSLPIGSHEIVFRHPQLGVKKQTVIVKVDGLTKVTQALGPGGYQP